MLSLERRPNLFLVGGAKCGTTSMHRYLEAHPDIYMSPVKEPYFFCPDLGMSDERRVAWLVDYEALFDARRAETWAGESSVWYLLSPGAAKRIRRYNPEARVLVMVRDPVAAAWSLHGQFVKSYNEDLVDFEAALAAEPDRTAGRRVPRSAHLPVALRYRRTVDYAPQIERFVRAFGRERVHVILYDDFAADAAASYRAVLEFIGADTEFLPRFERYNVSREIVLRPGRRFWKNRMALKAKLDATPGAGLAAWAITKLADRLASRRVERPARMAPETEYRLRVEFRPQVERLETLLDRDLSAWKAGGGQTG